MSRTPPTLDARPRTTLAEQLDRLDGILDGLADALNEAVADNVNRAVAAAAREAFAPFAREAGAAGAPAALSVVIGGPAGLTVSVTLSAAGLRVAAPATDPTHPASLPASDAARR